jgi:hypothetical protein
MPVAMASKDRFVDFERIPRLYGRPMAALRLCSSMKRSTLGRLYATPPIVMMPDD